MSGHVTEQLSAFFDGELDERERFAVARHLEACPECARHLDELQAVERLAAGMPVGAPQGYFDGFASRVRDRIRKPQRRFVLPAWALTAAAAVMLAVTVPVLLRRQLEVGPAKEPASAPASTLAAPAQPAPETQESLRALGYLEGQRKRDDAPAGGAAVAPPKKSRLKDESVPRSGFEQKLERPTPGPPPPAAPPPPAVAAPPAATPEPPAFSRDAPASEADALSETSPQQANRNALEERRQRAEDTAEKEQPQASGFAQAPQAEAPKRALQKTAPTSAAFHALLQRRAVTIAEARGLREAWRAFAQGAAEAEADEARVRVIESGRDAFRLSGDRADLDLARRDATAYLKREDARQGERVRAVLRDLPR